MSISNAIIYGNLQDVQTAIDHGEKINLIDDYGYTPLIQTAIVNNTDMTRLLLEHGANVNEPDLTGRTALHWAVDNQNIAMCQLLLEHKANPNAYNVASQPVLVPALLRNQEGIKNLLYEHGADLHFAKDYINMKLTGHLYELQGHVDIFSPEGKFLELEFDGFQGEFTLESIRNSLQRFKNNFTAREFRPYFKKMVAMIPVLNGYFQDLE